MWFTLGSVRPYSLRRDDAKIHAVLIPIMYGMLLLPAGLVALAFNQLNVWLRGADLSDATFLVLWLGGAVIGGTYLLYRTFLEEADSHYQAGYLHGYSEGRRAQDEGAAV